jgi:hypothetical protein
LLVKCGGIDNALRNCLNFPSPLCLSIIWLHKMANVFSFVKVPLPYDASLLIMPSSTV